MNICKLIRFDCKRGILRNLRLLILPLAAWLACLSAHSTITMLFADNGVTAAPSLADLWCLLFHGCSPILQCTDSRPPIPFFWIAVFLLSAFTAFDFAAEDLQTFGIQTITRTKKRFRWWLSKCIWCLAESVVCFLLFSITALLFAALHGCTFSLSGTPFFFEQMLTQTNYYTFNAVPSVTPKITALMLFSPMIVLLTTQFLQMTLSLFCKPIYSFCIVIGLVLLGTMVDFPLAFSRSGMLLTSDLFAANGFPLCEGLICCGCLILAAFLLGAVYFQQFDILPMKE